MVSEYASEKLRLGKEVGVSFEEAKGIVCAILKSSELANYLPHFDDYTVQDYLGHIREHQVFLAEKMKASTEKTKASNDTVPRRVTSASDHQKETSSSQNSNSQGQVRSYVRCYSCDEFAGHLSRDCPKERRSKFCTICKTERKALNRRHRSLLCEKYRKSFKDSKKNVIVAGAATKVNDGAKNRYGKW